MSPDASNTDRTGRIGVAIASKAFERLGFAFREQNTSDYGVDANAELILSERPTGRLLGIQIKSGPSYFKETSNDNIIFREDIEHVQYWLNHSLPMIICLCDVDKEIVYWQSIASENITYTDKATKIFVPKLQQINAASSNTLSQLLSPVIASDRYTVFRTDDSSHGLAKRYSVEVVINGEASKAEIASIARQICREYVKIEYHRNSLVESYWKGVDAHVIWIFIYVSAEDFRNRNHVCRCMWIDEHLPPNARPISLSGENIGNGIVISWNENNTILAELLSKHKQTKSEYFGILDEVMPHLKSATDFFSSTLQSLQQKTITLSHFLAVTKSYREKIDEINDQINSAPLPPFECKDVDSRLQCLIACLHNIVLYYSEKGLKNWDDSSRNYLSTKDIDEAKKIYWQLEYETGKIR